VIVGSAFAVWGGVVAVLAASVAVGAPAEFKTFLAWAIAAVALVVALAFANWAYSVATIAYAIEADSLVIRWGLRRVVIPIDTILRMVPGRTLDAPHISGLNWWGCHVGHSDVKRIGYTLFYSTHSAPQELLYVHTTQESYALTVLDQAAFAEEIQARAALAPIEEHAQRSTATGIAAFPFWRDRHAIAAAVASVLACGAMVGYVFTRYPDLPSVIQVNFPALGGIVRIGDKSELLEIAYAGAGILAVNLVVGIAVHARERAAGLWLLASGGILQAVLLAAAVAAFERA
jgi:hypothetical protein